MIKELKTECCNASFSDIHCDQCGGNGTTDFSETIVCECCNGEGLLDGYTCDECDEVVSEYQLVEKG